MTSLRRLALAALAFLLAAPTLAAAQTVYEGGSGPVVDVQVTRRYDGATVTQAAPAYVVTNPNGVSGASTSTAPVRSFRQTCTTGAVALPSNTFANGIVIKAPSANAGTAYIGGAGVTTSTGYPLAAGEAISYGVANSSQAFLVCSDAVSTIAVTGN